MARRSNDDRETRRLRAIAVACFVGLTLLFTAWGFPWDEVEARAVERLESALGAEARFETVEASLDWGTPKLRLRNGSINWPGGESLAVRYARVKPQLHWGWLIARPRFAVKLNTAMGQFRGWASPHRNTVSGTVEELVLASLPYERWAAAGLRLEGSAEVALFGSQDDGPWNGEVRFRAVNGTLTLPKTQFPLPYSLVEGQVALRDERVEIREELVMEGPMGRVGAAGYVARGVPDPGLSLDLRLDLRDPTLLQVLAATGLQIRPGAKQVHIGGTLSNPRTRARSARRR